MSEVHPLVRQLRFTFSEFARALRGVTDEDGARRFEPMNCISWSWNVAHLASQEQQRVIYHYWYHLGENMAIRQLLGHHRLPQFVGSIDDKAPFIG